jgi:transcriptional regulator with XRE-family HTH domain|tara:strand:+ start:2230 stop:2706 length:477 start_codon:yes stop_codon:yes gene_type:complete
MTNKTILKVAPKIQSKIDKKCKDMSAQEKENYLNSLGGRIFVKRLEKGWSQPDLGNMAGVTYQNIQFAENNAVGMPRYIKELAEALDTSIEYLVNGEQEPNVVRYKQHISIVSIDTPIKPDPNFDHYLVKIEKGKQLFLPDDVSTVGFVNVIFIGHQN